jgi:hypothetical protein
MNMQGHSVALSGAIGVVEASLCPATKLLN